jgi:hypothetical protein
VKIYTYSEARERLAEILNIAREEDVMIQGRGGEVFPIVLKKKSRSPFAIPGIKTQASTKDILQAVKDSRRQIAKPINPLDDRSSHR